jgi:hypothetical protein
LNIFFHDAPLPAMFSSRDRDLARKNNLRTGGYAFQAHCRCMPVYYDSGRLNGIFIYISFAFDLFRFFFCFYFILVCI